MTSIQVRSILTLSISLVVAMASGCSKKEQAADAHPAAVPAKAQAVSAATTATSVTAMVTAVDLGHAVGPDQMISDPDSAFAPGDTVHVVVQTNTSDSTGSLPGTIAMRFVGPGEKVVHEEARKESFSGPGIADFTLHDSKGLQPGRYRAEVRLDGGEAQTREFDVR